MSVRLMLIAVLVCAPSSALRADEGDDDLARDLADVLRDPRLPQAARVAAARTLGEMGPRAAAAVPEMVAQLDRLRGAELETLQEAIIDAMGRIGSPARAGLPAFARAAGRTVDIDQAIKRSAGLILAAADTQDVDALMRQLLSRDPSMRLRAVKALGNLGPAARIAVPNLVTALSDKDADVRRAAVVALRLMLPNEKPNVAVVRAIAADLQDADPLVRAAAARSLARLGSVAAAAVPALEALVADPDPDVRKAAVEALSRVGGR